MYINPAELVDGRREWEINLFNIDGYALSDSYKWTGGSPDNLGLGGAFGGVNKSNQLFAASLQKGDGTGPVSFGVNSQGLSFMLHTGKNLAFGFGTRSRTGVQFGDFTNIPDLSAFAAGSSTPITNASLTYKAASFSELSLHAAAILLNDKANFIKAGASVKMLNSIFGEKATINNLNYMVKDDTSKHSVNYSLQSDGFYNTGDRIENIFNAASVLTGGLAGNHTNYGAGFGVDFGAVYEYRPEEERNPVKTEDTYSDQEHNNINKYLWKISVSATDVGSSVSYKENLKKYSITVNKSYTAPNDPKKTFIYPVDSISAQKGLAGAVGANGDAASSFIVNLPATFRISVDYHMTKRLYLNVAYAGNIKSGDMDFGSRSYLSVTPRLETPNFEAAIPISFRNGFKTFSAGGMIYFANIFFVGSDDIISNLLQKSTQQANIYAGIVLGVNRKKPISDLRIKENEKIRENAQVTPGEIIIKTPSRPNNEGVKPGQIENTQKETPKQPSPPVAQPPALKKETPKPPPKTEETSPVQVKKAQKETPVEPTPSTAPKPVIKKQEAKPSAPVDLQPTKSEKYPITSTENMKYFLDSLTLLVYFHPESVALDAGSYPSLNRLIQYMAAFPSGNLVILCNKSSKLQSGRAAAVKNYLMQQGVTKERIVILHSKRMTQEEPLNFYWRK